MSHETVTLVSPATTLTLLPADADEPLPPQLARNMVTIITMVNAKILFISMTSYLDSINIRIISLTIWKKYVFPSGTCKPSADG
jgi:hypothetical protein